MVVLGYLCFVVTINSSLVVALDEIKYPVLIICNHTLNKLHTVLFFSFVSWFSPIVGFVDQCLYH